MASGKSGVTPYLVYLVFITTLGPLQFGYHLAELNAPQAVLTCERDSLHSSTERFPQCIPMNPSQFGLVSSIYTLGGLVGALSAGPVATKYGRLLALRATTLFFILGPLVMSMAASIFVMSFGRLLAGVGAGAAIVVGPIYISEIAPPGARGFFGAFTQIMTNVGILLTQTLGLFLSKRKKWRIILVAASIIGAVELFGLFLVPESPIWLAEHDKAPLAKRVLQLIRGDGAEVDAEIAGWDASARPGPEEEEETLLAQPDNASAKQPPVTILRAITDSAYRTAIIAVVGVMMAQQFTGINSIVMYSVSLLQSILPTRAALLTVMISAINLVITLACSPLPDKIGRRKCLLLSITGVGCDSILLALGIYFNQKALSAIAALLFVAFFAVGLGPVPFILASELVGPEAVGATQSWALSANWIATFVVAQFFPVVNDSLGGRGKVYWIFAMLAGLLGGFIYGFVPETKGKASADEVWGREDRRED